MPSYDQRWSDAMTGNTAPHLDRIALAFDRSGRGVVRAGTLATIGLGLASRRRWRGLAAFAVAEAATPAAVNAIKLVIRRERPAIARVDPFGSSFPSGHASYAAATCTALALLMAGEEPPAPAVVAVAAAGTLGMAWSRTHLQAHWLSDVTAGALIGVAVTVAAFALIDG